MSIPHRSRAAAFPIAQYNERGQRLLTDWAVWDDFKLVQPNADGFTVLKRTNPKSTWLQAGAGKRASGLAFAGDVSGGLAVSLKNFWQSYPTALEVHGAASGECAIDGLDVVARCARHGPAPLRHQGPRPGIGL